MWPAARRRLAFKSRLRRERAQRSISYSDGQWPGFENRDMVVFLSGARSRRSGASIAGTALRRLAWRDKRLDWRDSGLDSDDGTIEAIRIADAPGFALGVQWHAEYDPQKNPINRALFQAFGDAVRAKLRAA